MNQATAASKADHFQLVQNLYNEGSLDLALNYWTVYQLGTFEEFQSKIGKTC